MRPLLWIYRFILFFVAPFLPFYLKKRIKKGKEDWRRVYERYGYSALKRPDGKCIWIHAASVGEAQSALILVKRILDLSDNLFVLITSGTVTSANLLSQRLPKRAYHQYVPLDHVPWVNRFLTHWRPNICLWIESELWPNMIFKASRFGRELVLVNGRMSDASFKKWSRLKPLAKSMFKKFSLCLTQDGQQKERFEALGCTKVMTTDNLKWAAAPLEYDHEELKVLKKQIGNRPFWVAASTHPGEEYICAQVHQKLRKEYPDLLTIIVPRHPERGDSLAEDLKGFRLVRRSQDEGIMELTEVYLADTLGEIGLFFKLAPIVFIGGSMVKREDESLIGGHNPIEPAHFNCAILHGEDMSNNLKVIADFHEKEACLQVRDMNDLSKKVKMLLDNKSGRQTLARHAKTLATKKMAVIDDVMEQLMPYLKKVI